MRISSLFLLYLVCLGGPHQHPRVFFFFFFFFFFYEGTLFVGWFNRKPEGKLQLRATPSYFDTDQCFQYEPAPHEVPPSVMFAH